VTRALNWLGWAAMAAVIAASFVYESSPLSGEILCVSRRITGYACPGCGLTRAFCAMARLEVGAAFGFHLAGPWLWLTAAGAVVWAPLQKALGLTPLWERAPRLMNVWFMLFGVLFGAHIVRWAAQTLLLIGQGA